jgi:hypothetical protein
VRRTRLPLLLALVLPIPLHAAPVSDIVDFDVDGDGQPTAALQLRQVGNRLGGFLRLTHSVALVEGRAYCASFQIAVDNHANGRSGRFRFLVDVGAHHFESVTEIPLPGTVTRDVLRSVFVADATTDSEILIEVQHDSGPEDDPTLYIDAVQITPLDGVWLQDRYEQQVRVDAAAVLGWEHDFGRLGLQRADYVGVAQVELVVWDDELGAPDDGLEWIQLSVNGIAVPGTDIDGSAAAPYRVRFSLPWIECRSGFDGWMDMRLRTIPVRGEPAGDLFFGAATTRLLAGQLGTTVLDNGDFERGARGWVCDGAPCGPTAIEAATWSAVKRRYLVR